MTIPADQIRAHRLRLGLTQGQAARLVGVDARTWRRWEQPAGAIGARSMPEPNRRLFLLLDMPAVRERLDSLPSADSSADFLPRAGLSD